MFNISKMLLEIYEELCLKNEKINKINEKKIANISGVNLTSCECQKMLVKSDILQNIICASHQFITRQLLNSKIKNEAKENAQQVSHNLVR